ncbi:MAG TPA: ABC transporter permease [Firmicutes bacterium]|jgi:simple sugar transport system permease protein|nr:ABC transporter permease [Bacillota bacterium]HBK59304.1 ABC transporter permease [Bacillota bacterium]
MNALKLVFEKREAVSPAYKFISPLLAIVMSLVLGAIFLLASGFSPLKVYYYMWWGAFSDWYGISETLVTSIPIMLCALGVALAAKMLLWNVGAEGQFHMGACAAAWVALSMPGAPAWQVLPLMVLAGMAAGALWALLPAVPRAYLGVNEIITTLLLNYVAIYWVEYLVHGPWRDPVSLNFPLSAPFSDAARLPFLFGTRIHWGLVFALAAAALIWFVLGRTKWGYEVTVIGENPRAARYAGMNIERNIVLSMCIAGALAGLGGMAEISAIAGRMTRQLSPGYGYSAIIVAWLGKLNPWAVALVSVLFGGLLVGGYSAQVIGVTAASVNMLQGLMLFCVLATEALGRYRVRIVREVARAGKEVGVDG